LNYPEFLMDNLKRYEVRFPACRRVRIEGWGLHKELS
jgi:hypothetical protein